MIKILIVEDEAILALNTQMILKQLGHDVVGIVDNGNDAIEITEREKPDVILMDIVLKGSMSGIEASEVINRFLFENIIYTTAHTDHATLEAAEKTNHIGFLFKPFERQQLKQMLDKLDE